MQNYIFDATFTENVLIVGRTGCGKTYFAQKLTVNRFFGRIKIVKWVLYIDLSGEREPEIDSSFSCKVEFRYLKSIEQFDDLLDIFKLRSKTAKRKDTDSNEDTSLTTMMIMKVIVLEKKQPKIGLLLWTTLWV